MSLNGPEKIKSTPVFDKEKNKNPVESNLKRDEESLAKDLIQEPSQEPKTPSFDEIFPNGIYNPELNENNEIYKDDPYKAPINTAAFLGRKYMAELYKLPQTRKIRKDLSKIENKIQDIYKIKGFVQKDLGTNDPLLKDVFKNKEVRTKWLEENPEHKKHTKLAYLYKINELLNSGIFETFKEFDKFFETEELNFPPLESTYTPEILNFYKERQKEFKEIKSNPFQKESMEGERTETLDQSKKERQELQGAIALDNAIIGIESSGSGTFETERKAGELDMEYIRKSLEDFSPENIEKHISDIKAGNLSESDKKILIDSMIRYIYENKESFSKENYEKIFSSFLNLSTQIQNEETSPERTTESTIRHLNFMDGMTKTKKIAQSTASSSPKFQTPLL
ncbi:MAG: hypothetical protein RBS56_01655 [Candidatus Gracilibacteria bacterium]|jgi:hypothetical protein|nr:hypothetical protein [Candidatus Gracilibacteria bacterium]